MDDNKTIKQKDYPGVGGSLPALFDFITKQFPETDYTYKHFSKTTLALFRVRINQKNLRNQPRNHWSKEKLQRRAKKKQSCGIW